MTFLAQSSHFIQFYNIIPRNSRFGKGIFKKFFGWGVHQLLDDSGKADSCLREGDSGFSIDEQWDKKLPFIIGECRYI
jgi:hypothetical protein